MHATVVKSTFGSENAQNMTLVRSDVEKLHAAVAKSTFASQNVQNMRCLDHFSTF